MAKSKQRDSSIIRVHKGNNFSVLNNTGLRDQRLHYGARGILAYLLTKPDDWQVRTEDLVAESPHGEDAVLTMLRELETFGYLKREKRRDEKGHWKWHTEVYEVPQKTKVVAAEPLEMEDDDTLDEELSEEEPYRDFPGVVSPGLENPDLDKPGPVSPGLENPGTKEILSDEELNKEVLNKKTLIVSSVVDASATRQAAPKPASQPTAGKPSFLPDPSLAPDTRTLAGICGVNCSSPRERDVLDWPEAVATVRDSMPDASPGQRAEAVQEFGRRFRDGGKRGHPYVGQVKTWWYRLMAGYHGISGFDASNITLPQGGGSSNESEFTRAAKSREQFLQRLSQQHT